MSSNVHSISRSTTSLPVPKEVYSVHFNPCYVALRDLYESYLWPTYGGHNGEADTSNGLQLFQFTKNNTVGNIRAAVIMAYNGLQWPTMVQSENPSTKYYDLQQITISYSHQFLWRRGLNKVASFHHFTFPCRHPDWSCATVLILSWSQISTSYCIWHLAPM